MIDNAFILSMEKKSCLAHKKQKQQKQKQQQQTNKQTNIMKLSLSSSPILLAGLVLVSTSTLPTANATYERYQSKRRLQKQHEEDKTKDSQILLQQVKAIHNKVDDKNDPKKSSRSLLRGRHRQMEEQEDVSSSLTNLNEESNHGTITAPVATLGQTNSTRSNDRRKLQDRVPDLRGPIEFPFEHGYCMEETISKTFHHLDFNVPGTLSYTCPDGLEILRHSCSIATRRADVTELTNQEVSVDRKTAYCELKNFAPLGPKRMEFALVSMNVHCGSRLHFPMKIRTAEQPIERLRSIREMEFEARCDADEVLAWARCIYDHDDVKQYLGEAGPISDPQTLDHIGWKCKGINQGMNTINSGYIQVEYACRPAERNHKCRAA